MPCYNHRNMRDFTGGLFTTGGVMPQSWKRILIKVLAVQVVFLFLHYAYDWFPNAVTTLFSGTDESTYQHMKIAFFSSLLVSLGEGLLLRGRLAQPARFLFPRLFTAVLLPFLVMVFFYTGPAYFGRFTNLTVEIVAANLSLVAASSVSFIVERALESAESSPGLRWAIVLLFVVMLSELVIFTYRLPWADVFANPPGW